jgi:hypothetical protein
VRGTPDRGALAPLALPPPARAHAARRVPGSALAARYRRIARRRGEQKAILAVAHALLDIAYHVIANETTYQELGFDYYDERAAERAERRAIALLVSHGYRVERAA